MTNIEVKKELKSLNLPLWRLAKQIGVHLQTLHYWLHDDVIPDNRAERISKALEELRNKN